MSYGLLSFGLFSLGLLLLGLLSFGLLSPHLMTISIETYNFFHREGEGKTIEDTMELEMERNEAAFKL